MIWLIFLLARMVRLVLLKVVADLVGDYYLNPQLVRDLCLNQKEIQNAFSAPMRVKQSVMSKVENVQTDVVLI